MADEKGPLGFLGDTYWDPKSQSIAEVAMRRLDSLVDGMILDAPTHVYHNIHSTIPVVCLRTSPTEKLHTFSLKKTTYLVCNSMETNFSQIVKLAPTPARADNRKPSPGFTGERMDLDLNSIIPIISQTGSYIIWLVCGPEVSNQRIIQILPTKESENTKEIKDTIGFLRKDRSISKTELYIHLVDIMQHPFASTEKNDNTWNFIIEKQTGSTTRIHLRYKILGLPSFLLPDDQVKYDPDGKQVYAYLPVTFVGFNEDRKLSILQQSELPVIEKIGGTEEAPLLNGDISFPLSEILPKNNKDHLLILWAVFQEHRAVLELQLEKK